MVRFMKTEKLPGVRTTVVVSSTRKVNSLGGSAWYGTTVPFVKAIVGLMKGPGVLASGIASAWERSTLVDSAPPTRTAIRMTGSAFSAKRFTLRSPR